MFRQSFYFGTLRKYVTLFGTLFDDIFITREDKDGIRQALIKVPVTYAAKEKMLSRVVSDPNIDRPMATTTLPLISFEMTNITYDGARKLNTIRRSVVSGTDANSMKYQYNPVAYNIGFRLYIYVKNAEDGTKIVEQILPYFTPDWTTSVHLIPEMNITMDIPIILNSINQEDTYNGGFKERQAIIWTLDFTLKGYIYGPVKTGAIIKFANTILYSPSGNLVSSVGNTSPSSYSTIQPGLTEDGKPTSNIDESIDPNFIYATSDFGYVTNTVILTT